MDQPIAGSKRPDDLSLLSAGSSFVGRIHPLDDTHFLAFLVRNTILFWYCTLTTAYCTICTLCVMLGTARTHCILLSSQASCLNTSCLRTLFANKEQRLSGCSWSWFGRVKFLYILDVILWRLGKALESWVSMEAHRGDERPEIEKPAGMGRR